MELVKLISRGLLTVQEARRLAALEFHEIGHHGLAALAMELLLLHRRGH